MQKTRHISHLFQQHAGRPVNFEEVARQLRNLISCNVYVLNQKGYLLGTALLDDRHCEVLESEVVENRRVPVDYNDRLLQMDETVANLPQENGRCLFRKETSCPFEGKVSTIVPVVGSGERLGNLLLAKYSGEFSDDDLVIAEYSATVAAMEMLRARSTEIEDEARKRAAVEVAVGALSYSEMEAVQHIFDELNGNEGFLVASRIADRV
ncbi:MAG: GTP-sensing pleiotropic transcriptional regulator CodY, partial [Bacillota bacterium]